MATVKWPDPQKRTRLSHPTTRVDGPLKVSGAAKYTYDINRPGMLWARVLGSPHASAEVVSIDTSEAERLPGVKAVWHDADLIGSRVRYAGQIVAAVAAESEEIAAEAIKRIRVTYKPLPHQVDDTDLSKASGRPFRRETGKVDEALAQADVKVEGDYGLPSVAHCCLEAHGQVAEMRGEELYLWASTQAVTRYADRMGDSVGVPQSKIHVECQHIGGGFGSKFSHDKWGIIGAILAKKSGRPVKLMLERDEELRVAGNRPSAWAHIKVGVKKDGSIVAVDANIHGTGGMGGYSPPPVPYVFTKIPNTRLTGQTIRTNRGGARAWRAPNHPQACFLTMSALADAAAALKMDALEFFLKNIELTDRPEVYAEELRIAAEMIAYKQKAHLPGDPTPGPIKRGLGISLHTWGGLGHPSECDVTINPDGSVEARLGSQDLGTGTRTVIAQVLAETVGLPVDAVTVKIGSNAYPPSGSSGGSTTVGGVSVSTRRAAVAAVDALLQVVARQLGVPADQLEARDGFIRQIGAPDKRMRWQDACALLGPNPITKRGSNNPAESRSEGLIDANVGGVQIADVSVDIETGVVTLNEMVGVQDCGLVVNPKTAESQVYGGMIMGITYALYEELVYDQQTGQLLNPDMEFYRLAGIKDIGQLKVHLMRSDRYDSRGIIGLGEPPVISPGAAIANAVANAIGVRVPYLPLTPDRVIAALQKGGLLS